MRYLLASVGLLLFIAVAHVAQISATRGRSAALRARVTPRAMEHFMKVGEDVLKDIILHMKIPRIHYAEGKNRIDITNMVILRYTDPRIYYKFESPSTVMVGITMKRLEFRGSYEAERTLITAGFMDKLKSVFGRKKSVGIKDHGVMGAQVGNYNQKIKIEVHKDISGKFLLHTTRCMTIMDDFIADVRTSRALDWMIGKVSEQISKELEPILANGICKATEDYINKNTNDFLHTLPTLNEMFYHFYFDSALTQHPRVTDHYIETEHSAEVMYMPNPNDFPLSPSFQPVPIPPQQGGDRMIYAWGSEYIINSALHHAHKRELFNIIVSKRKFAEYADYLKTDCGLFSVCLASLWPTLGTTYPGAHGNLQVYSIDTPKITVTTDGVGIDVKARFKIDLELSTGGPLQPLLDSIFTVKGLLKPRIDPNNNFFKGHFSISEVKFAISQLTDDGGLSRAQFEKMLGQIAGPIGSTVANSFLGPGFEIPDMVGVHLTRPELLLRNGFFELNTDVNYTLPFDSKELLGEAIRNTGGG